jgi:hypothetical protein
MKLQEQCCTREQGQRLIELGVNPEALFWWMPSMSGPHGEYIRYSYHGNSLAPAFNVAELGMLIPPTISEEPKEYQINHEKVSSKSSPYWFIEFSKGGILAFDTEAQARAALLIHLLENNLITL